jgi:hypothetical protein
MRRALILPLALLLAVSLAACDSSDPDPVQTNPSLSGEWRGSENLQGNQLSLNLQLLENNGVVNGTGTIQVQNSLAVSVSGIYNFPTVSLTMRNNTIEDVNFTGSLAADGRSINGQMSGSGIENLAFRLTKQ